MTRCFLRNGYCIQCERGLSSFDTRNRLVVSPLYELPVGKGKLLNINNGSANAIIGGWQAGGIVTIQSGIPQTISIGGTDNSNTQSGYDRPTPRVRLGASNPTPAGDQHSHLRRGSLGSSAIEVETVATAAGVFTIDAELTPRLPHAVQGGSSSASVAARNR